MLINSYELEPLEYIDEQETFLRILYHDSRGGNAIRLCIDRDHGIKDVYANPDYHKMDYRSGKYNVYTSVNTFKSYKRLSQDVWNYSAIYIDLDCHDKDLKTVSLDCAIENTKSRLIKAFMTNEISIPTMITFTGRGLGLFYVLNTSIANTPPSDKSIRYLYHVYSALMERYGCILAGDRYLKVDYAVKDKSRVCRLPLTFNHNIGRWCRLIHVSYNEYGDVRYYDLKELAECNSLFVKPNITLKSKKIIIPTKTININEFKMPFLKQRINRLEMLQNLRNYDCEGSRELMTFVHYNAATQLYGPEKGKESTIAFNNRFNEPLENNEIISMFEGVDRNVARDTNDYEGFYKLKDKWIKEKLDVTESENIVCKFGTSVKRQLEKENNKNRKQIRNRAIADRIIKEKNCSYTEIALRFGVSSKTVQRIAKQYHVNRYKKA